MTTTTTVGAAYMDKPTIDTPEFHVLMNEYDNEMSYGSINKARANLIAFIDAKLPTAAPADLSGLDAHFAAELPSAEPVYKVRDVQAVFNKVAAAAKEAPSDERQAFEAWEVDANVERDGDYYVNPCTQSAWDGWKARAQLAAPSLAAPGATIQKLDLTNYSVPVVESNSAHWPHGATEVACSSCGLTMGESRLLADLKRGGVSIAAPVERESKAEATKQPLSEFERRCLQPTCTGSCEDCYYSQRVAHPDDAAIEVFAKACKAKMAEGRSKGRGGWEDQNQCPTGRLQGMLLDHLEKGDPLDVALFCMMLWMRGAPVVAVNLKAKLQAVLEDAAIICDNFAKREMHPSECASAIRMMKGSIK